MCGGTCLVAHTNHKMEKVGNKNGIYLQLHNFLFLSCTMKTLTIVLHFISYKIEQKKGIYLLEKKNCRNLTFTNHQHFHVWYAKNLSFYLFNSNKLHYGNDSQGPVLEKISKLIKQQSSSPTPSFWSFRQKSACLFKASKHHHFPLGGTNQLNEQGRWNKKKNH